MSTDPKFIYIPGLSASEIQNLSGEQHIVKLSSNENPFGPSKLAIEAAQKSLSNVNRYPPRNDIELKQALVDFHKRGLNADNFYTACGGVEAISMAENVLIKSGDRAIISPPCFGAYGAHLNKIGAIIDEVPLKSEDYGLDELGILDAITNQTRLIYLCNPNNPTGTAFGEADLATIMDNVPEHVTVIYDEVYYQYSTEFQLPDAIKYVLNDKNIVVIHSFSKVYGLAGLRIGYGIAASEIVKKVEANKRPFHLNEASLRAAIAALKDKDHLSKTIGNNTRERTVLSEGIENCGLTVYSSKANHIMFKCPEGTKTGDFIKEFAKNAIMIRPAFYLPDHIRLTIGKPDENRKFLDVLGKFQAT